MVPAQNSEEMVSTIGIVLAAEDLLRQVIFFIFVNLLARYLESIPKGSLAKRAYNPASMKRPWTSPVHLKLHSLKG